MFDNTFNDDIFVGNHQFVVSRYFQPREQLPAMTEREKIVFLKRPLHKSCFTSLRKKSYKYFCTNCKKSITIFLKKSYMFFLELLTMDEVIRMRKLGTRTLLWYYANDQKVVNEIKCCDCFFDIMLVFKERFLNFIDENDVDNEILEKNIS